MSPSLPVFHDIRLVTVTTNELCEKETTNNINLLRAMGKIARKIAEQPTQFRQSGRPTAIELETEK
jgi:hypothetical protein